MCGPPESQILESVLNVNQLTGTEKKKVQKVSRRKVIK